MEFLQPLDKPDSFPPMLRAIFNTYRGALEYPASKEARAAKIARDTVFFVNDSDPDIEDGGALSAIWYVLMQMVSHIPAGHDWQQTLVLAVDSVRQREPADNDEFPDIDWINLPELSIVLREHWEYKPFAGDETDPVPLAEWQNANSFVAHLVGCGHIQPLYLGMWEIRSALEEAPKPGPLMDCRAWVAAEWILCSSKVLLEDMNLPNEELDEHDVAVMQPGQLYGSDLHPRSLRRWEFWKKRLAEIAKESDGLGLEAETKNRVEEALKVMESESAETGGTGADPDAILATAAKESGELSLEAETKDPVRETPNVMES